MHAFVCARVCVCLHGFIPGVPLCNHHPVQDADCSMSTALPRTTPGCLTSPRVTGLSSTVSDPGSPHPPTLLILSPFFILDILIGVWWQLTVAVICISLTANGEFRCLCAVRLSSGEMSVPVFYPFSNWIIFVFNFESSFSILATSPFEGLVFKYFSQL